jgi:hypothetical protein
MSKQFTAHIPAIKTFQAHDVVCVCSDEGKWTMAIGPYPADPALESDIIDKCSKATNWQAIRAEFFAMEGFFAGGEIVDRTPEHKQDY